MLGSVNPAKPNHIRMTLLGSGVLGDTYQHPQSGVAELLPAPEETLAHEVAHVAELTGSMPKEVADAIANAWEAEIGGNWKPTKQDRSEAIAHAVTKALSYMRGQHSSRLQDLGGGVREAYSWLKARIK